MSCDCIKLELLQLTQVQLTRDCAGIKMFLGVCCSEHDSMHGCSVGRRGRLAIEPLRDQPTTRLLLKRAVLAQ